MTTTIKLRSPTTTTTPQTTPDPNFSPPSTTWLEGTWHVTHSTLPMWKKSRNVTITYSPIPNQNKLLDTVRHQSLNADKIKTITGIDTPGKELGTWDWRGKGWLVIASSHWEILGFGGEEDQRWVVTYFEKTLFTPAGLDIYSRGKAGLSEGMLTGIKEALRGSGVDVVRRLGEELFEVRNDC